MASGSGMNSDVPTHRGWYSRGYLPHRDEPGLTQFITFRLADSMPKVIVQEWKRELRTLPDSEAKTQLQVRINHYIDGSSGSSVLRRPDVGGIVEQTLLNEDGTQYELLAWVVMPNHVHLLARFKEVTQMPDVVKTWKGVSARLINEVLQRRGRLWYREYFDRFIRDAEHFDRVVRYIEYNPVKAGLSPSAEAWPLSSARFRSPAD